MKMLGKLLLRGLAVVLPIVITIAVLAWLATAAESVLGDLVPEGRYFPGIGILAALVLVFVVGLLTHFWLFRALVNWLEREVNKIPLVKTLYLSVKDLMGFFPGGGRKAGLQQVVIASVAGMRLIGMVTREEFDDLPEALHGVDEVLVYFPMSYQLGGFTFWVPRSQVRPVELTVAEGMRFAMTGGMSTKSAGDSAATHPKEDRPA